jgi:hypothetical protein
MGEPIYQETAQAAPAQAPTSQTPVMMDETAVQRMINQALEQQQQRHDEEIGKIREQLAVARAQLPATLIPGNSGGVGADTVNETWSQYDQELANRGEHPHQHGKSADWLALPA